MNSNSISLLIHTHTSMFSKELNLFGIYGVIKKDRLIPLRTA